MLLFFKCFPTAFLKSNSVAARKLVIPASAKYEREKNSLRKIEKKIENLWVFVKIEPKASQLKEQKT